MFHANTHSKFNFVHLDVSEKRYPEFDNAVLSGEKYNVFKDGSTYLSFFYAGYKCYGQLKNRDTLKSKYNWNILWPQTQLVHAKTNLPFCTVQGIALFTKIKTVRFQADNSEYRVKYDYASLHSEENLIASATNAVGQVVFKLMDDPGSPVYRINDNANRAGKIEILDALDPDKIIGFLAAVHEQTLRERRSDD